MMKKTLKILQAAHLIKRSSPFAFPFLLFGFFIHAAHSEPIYRHVDASGRVTFSTTPDDANSKPQELPEIRRESSKSRIESLKKLTPLTCNNHGSVDCAKGQDGDASVICADGFRDSAEAYAEFCAQVRLQIDAPTVFDRDGKEFTPRTPEEMQRVGEARITVRNLSAVHAEGVVGELRFPRPAPSIPISGPAKVDPYGLAEYTVDLTAARSMYLQKFLQMKPALRCTNCRIVLGSR